MFIIAVSSCHIEPLLKNNILCLLQIFKSNLSDDTIPSLLSFYCHFHCCSVAQPVQLFKTPWTAASQASLSFTISQRLLKLMSIESVMTWKHLPSVVLFSSCLQSFPASGSFPMSQFFPSGDQSIGTSASASVLSMNIQDRFPLGLTSLIPLQSKGLPRVSLFQHHSPKASILQCSAFSMVQLSHPYMITGKTRALTIRKFVDQGMSLLFNTLV